MGGQGSGPGWAETKGWASALLSSGQGRGPVVAEPGDPHHSICLTALGGQPTMGGGAVSGSSWGLQDERHLASAVI